PFDRARELARVVRALRLAHERWATGIFAIWYPLLKPGAMRDFAEDVRKSRIRKILQLELSVREAAAGGPIPGCGLLVVNPPWHFDREARALLDWLWRALAPGGAGGVHV